MYSYDPIQKSWKEDSLIDKYLRPKVQSLQSVSQQDGSLYIYAVSTYEDQPGSNFVILSTDNGVSWQESYSDRFSASTILNVNLTPDFSILAHSSFSMKNPSSGNTVLVESRLWKSTNDGKDWHTVLNSLYVLGPYRGPDGELFFTNTKSRTIHRSTDNGDSWYQWNDTLPWTLGYIGIDTYGRMYGTTNDVFARSDDHGKTWYSFNYEFPSNYTPDFIRGYSVGPDRRLVVYKQWDIYYSSDDGVTWTHEAYPFQVKDVENIVYTRSGKLLLSLEDGSLWKKESTDSSWNKTINLGVIDNFLTDSVGGIYAENGRRVWYSPDEGTSWELATNEHYEYARVSIEEDNNVYVPAVGKILRHPVPVPLSVPFMTAQNRERYGLQLHTHTEAGSGVIEFTLPATTNVLLQLVDVKGQTTILVNNESLSSGIHHYDLPEGLASGRYIVRLCTEDGCESTGGVVMW